VNNFKYKTNRKQAKVMTQESNLQLVAKILQDHERDSWFAKPLDQEITIRGLKAWVNGWVKENGGVLQVHTTKVRFKEIVRRYEAKCCEEITYRLKGFIPMRLHKPRAVPLSV